MLPEDWKREIEDTIGKATNSAAKKHDWYDLTHLIILGFTFVAALTHPLCHLDEVVKLLIGPALSSRRRREPVKI